ncbi:histidine phosphatase family protein [Nocardioides yefusunii]|uniref:Histidine phosphatase family protein n=1 Tax=Nocardioides yefusunii TaxID=2500546 RepID=A0ABW1R394_9ACTN|nr:histidine phosphatase family protein [Nocardioides yefusunii]
MGQVLLVRHGQASFGTSDYDRLSTTGEHQAGLVGAALAASGVVPDRIVHGGLRRQRDTAALAIAAAGWDVPVAVDERWDEFELIGSAERMDTTAPDGARLFQTWYEEATDRWLAGDDEPGQESRDAFESRVLAALADASGSGTTLVVTSGGPIATVAAHLVDGGRPAYRKLMPAMVNTSVTTVLSGRRGLTLVSWNTHVHLTREQTTYR